MNSQIQRKSAQILQFPPPGSRLRNSRSGEANIKQNRTSSANETIDYGGSWYHEAALIEAGYPRKP